MMSCRHRIPPSYPASSNDVGSEVRDFLEQGLVDRVFGQEPYASWGNSLWLFADFQGPRMLTVSLCAHRLYQYIGYTPWLQCSTVAMMYCCVPFGKPQKGKTLGVYFHLFPSDAELCSKSQKNNYHKKLIIVDESASIVVRSKHFNESDYVPRCRIWKVHVGAILTIFDLYPSYKVPAAKKSRKDSACRDHSAPRNSTK